MTLGLPVDCPNDNVAKLSSVLGRLEIGEVHGSFPALFPQRACERLQALGTN